MSKRRYRTRIIPLDKALNRPLNAESMRLIAEGVLTLSDGTEKHLSFGPDTMVAINENEVIYVYDPAPDGGMVTRCLPETPDAMLNPDGLRMLRGETRKRAGLFGQRGRRKPR